MDAGYGSGKTFFLKRLKDVIATEHPVAYVDAWSDDLQDEPFIALLATLQEALQSRLDKSRKVEKEWKEFLGKSSVVAKAVAGGVFRRAGALLFTEVGVEGVEAAFRGIDVLPGDLTKAFEIDSADLKTSNSVDDRLQKRLADFTEAKSAVIAMKQSLRLLLDQIGSGNSTNPKIYIIIDEVDRCRPTYSIKLFEEVKHLFDVEGLVFIFGMHQDALARSVVGAYGPEFDGWSYLRRFITKTYRLKEPVLQPLLQQLIEDLAIDSDRLIYPPVVSANMGAREAPLAEVISEYMKDFKLKAREAFDVVDELRTCLALTGGEKLYLAYLLPLILSKFSKSYDGLIIQPENSRLPWSLHVYGTNISPYDYAIKFRRFSLKSTDDLMNIINSSREAPVERVVFGILQSMEQLDVSPLASPRNYPLLLESVDRFA